MIILMRRYSLKHVLALFSFIFVVWTIFRYFPEPPAWVTELILKPLVWLAPTFWLVRKVERQPLSSLGFTTKKLFPSLYWGIGLGMIFALEGLLTNIFKYKGLNLIPLDYTPAFFLGTIGLSLATAFTEETVFRGYIFSRLRLLWKNEWLANIVASLL
ncbi:hypothetical protein COX09_01185, partial [Candidatus Beckwithbacteria bacterium CG23_combo_of_CG06-09_8_20_14_all_47_9]